jgi:uncharacterized Zn finger protein
LLFRLRGRSQEQIIEALRARRAASAAENSALAEQPAAYMADAPAPPLEDTLENFWRLGGSLEHFPAIIRPPAAPLAVLRRLGQPSFVDQDLEQVLGPLYAEASRQALAMGFQDEEAGIQPDEADNEL